MARWELWVSTDDTGHAFFREDNSLGRALAEADGFTFEWAIDAVGGNEAMAALHARIGYGPYEPMRREDGTPYPEDEIDPV